MASPTPREIAMEARKREFDAKRRAANRQSRANLLGMASNPGALLRGAADIPGSVYRYLRDNEPVEIGEDVSRLASDMAADFRKDRVKFAVDMVNPVTSVQDFADIRAQARDFRAAGDLDTASTLEQIAAMSPLSVVPFVGRVVGKGAKAAAKAATKKAASLAVKPAKAAAEKAPLAVERAAQPYFAPGSPERAANLSKLMEGAHPEAFGESGLPKDFYHGTADNIYEFDLEHPNRHDAGWLGRGAYLWDKPKTAGDYAGLKAGREYPNVLPLHASFKNPYFATLKDKQRLMLIEHAEGKEAASEASRAWTDELMGKGHDSVILKEAGIGWRDAPNEYVVFDPARVKSRFNRGTFDPSEPEINKAHGGRVSPLAVKRKGKK